MIEHLQRSFMTKDAIILTAGKPFLGICNVTSSIWVEHPLAELSVPTRRRLAVVGIPPHHEEALTQVCPRVLYQVPERLYLPRPVPV